MPDPQRLLKTLHQAGAAFRHTPGRRGRFVELTEVSDVLVSGDLHGDLMNFKRLLELADLARYPQRHLVLQEVIHGPSRYPNSGGDQSHRLLDLLAALKCQYPQRVHMLLGNHELSQWTGRAIMKAEEDLNEVFRLGVETAYGNHAPEIYCAYENLMSVLPVALRTPNRVFLSHSLPGGSRLDSWDLTMICKDEAEEADYKLGGCIHAVAWGRDLSAANAKRYLEKVDADLLISGHIPCDEGFQVPNEHQLILDCKDEQACCCLFPADRPLTQQDLLGCVIRLHEEDQKETDP
jgi:hypothetical protein